MTAPKKFDLLRHLGPFDLYTRTTLRRLARERGKMDETQAAALVESLIKSGAITKTKYTGLINDAPLYQKRTDGPLE